MPQSFHLIKQFLSLALLLLMRFNAWSNVGPPPEPPGGQINGSPFVSGHCVITSEELEIDLRPLENLLPALVTATYNFTSDTSSDSVELILVANNLKGENFSIVLDGKKIDGDTTSLPLVPDHWLTPRKLHFQEYSELIYDSSGYRASWYTFGREESVYVRFRIPVDSGDHVLRVMYDADVPQSFYGTTRTHLFTYILSPARDWKDYHALNLRLYLPEGWVYESNFTLTKSGEVLTGKWNHLPADYFYVVTKQSDEWADVLQFGFVFGMWGLLILFVLWRIYAASAKFVSGKISAGHHWTVVLWYMAIAAIVFFMIFAFREDWMSLWYGNQLDPDLGYGDSYMWLGIPFIWFFGVGGGYLFQAVVHTFLVNRKKKEGNSQSGR